MRISKKRIINPDNYLQFLEPGSNFYIGLTNLTELTEKLTSIGFSSGNIPGEQLLPSIVGRISKFNANGGHNLLRDLPKEIYYREMEFKDWHGNYHTSYIGYHRFQREPIPAPSIELLIRNGATGQPILVSPLQTNNSDNYTEIKHIINLFLEIFGECEILHEDLLPTFSSEIRRLNWDILPNGHYPWTVLAPRVQTIINTINRQRKGVVQRYIERISSHNPHFVAVGRAGFRGYMIFGFPNKDFFILESAYTGNATYILGSDWEEISKLTKEEILDQNLHEQRIIHTTGWDNEIGQLLN